MSMNIYITAVREVQYKDRYGESKEAEQRIAFDCWQTPTAVTQEILKQDTLQAKVDKYISFIKSRGSTLKMPVYAEDDTFGESNPISFEDYNAGDDHIAQLLQWFEEVQEDGYTVVFEQW